MPSIKGHAIKGSGYKKLEFQKHPVMDLTFGLKIGPKLED